MLQWILDILRGAVIGVSNIIPGVSGGTMAVSMGIYDRVIFAVNNLFKQFRKNMKELLLKITDRLSEGGTAVVTDALRIGNLKGFLLAVCTMKNQWYYENRFNPYGLNNDFEKIYSNLVNNSDHARRKAAFDYL